VLRLSANALYWSDIKLVRLKQFVELGYRKGYNPDSIDLGSTKVPTTNLYNFRFVPPLVD